MPDSSTHPPHTCATLNSALPIDTRASLHTRACPQTCPPSHTKHVRVLPHTLEHAKLLNPALPLTLEHARHPPSLNTRACHSSTILPHTLEHARHLNPVLPHTLEHARLLNPAIPLTLEHARLLNTRAC